MSTGKQMTWSRQTQINSKTVINKYKKGDTGIYTYNRNQQFALLKECDNINTRRECPIKR